MEICSNWENGDVEGGTQRMVTKRGSKEFVAQFPPENDMLMLRALGGLATVT